MITVMFLIRGRVQGVGYRRFVQKQAEALSLSGWTRNLKDGRVEVKARGTETGLDQFEDKLRKGPLFSSVEEVGRMPLDDQPMTGFEIRADGAAPEGQ
ncbi:MAG TPA: acylphosphatase [Pseudobdellovibrionaceae bacterium]|nr:acylphosphatase [Pseudobdellovibrionaceae bacterium]